MSQLIRNLPAANEDMTGNVVALQDQLRRLQEELSQVNFLLTAPRSAITQQQQQHAGVIQAQASDYSEGNARKTIPAQRGPPSGDLPVSLILDNRLQKLELALSQCVSRVIASEADQERLIKQTELLQQICDQKEQLVQQMKFLFKLGRCWGPLDCTSPEQQQQLQYINNMLEMLLNPEQNPDVIQQVIENIHIRDQLSQYEQYYDGDLGAEKEEMNMLRMFGNGLCTQIVDLVSDKHKLIARITSLEEHDRKYASAFQELQSVLHGKEEQLEQVLGFLQQREDEITQHVQTIRKLERAQIELQDKHNNLLIRSEQITESLQVAREELAKQKEVVHDQPPSGELQQSCETSPPDLRVLH